MVSKFRKIVGYGGKPFGYDPAPYRFFAFHFVMSIVRVPVPVQ